MNSIGGYLELELSDNKTVFHDKAVAVNSGRNALEYILLSNKFYKKIFVPFYSCDAIVQPITKLKLDLEFYALSADFTPAIKELKKNEALIFVNYFGMMNKKLKRIIKKFNNVIVDNSQAFFAKPIGKTPTFYSPRKFFGLPDGGFAYTNNKINVNLERDKSIDRCGHLLKRLEDSPESGFKDFKQNDAKLANLPLHKMSITTERLLRNIKFRNVLKIRNENFMFLCNHLRELNELTPIIEDEKINGPMVYPFLRQNNKKIREALLKKKIYVATYWPNVLQWTSRNSLEYYLAENLIPLPIDQRYSIPEMKIILSAIG